MDDLLLIPGPVQVPPQVRQATAQPMINHRGPEFAALHREVTEALRPIFGTSHDILIFPSAGTGVMEAAIVNLFSPGERVLVCAMGEFGRRFAAIGRAFGLEVDVEEVEWGTAVTAERVAARLDATTYRGVLVTQNETSTGVALDLASVAAAVRGRGALLVVDAISALAGMPMEADRWGVDVVVAASQKALMTPPGLGLVSVSPAAWEANATARLPRFYWDFQRARASAEKGQTPYTPAVSLWFGLREGLRLIAEEGLVNCFARYRRMGAMLRAGVRAMGLQTLAEDAVASPVVTAVRVPAGVDGGRLLRDLRERHRIVAAGGQGPLQGKIFRVAHMGMTQPSDILRTLVAVADCLQAQGVDASADQAVAAAEAAGRGAA